MNCCLKAPSRKSLLYNSFCKANHQVKLLSLRKSKANPSQVQRELDETPHVPDCSVKPLCLVNLQSLSAICGVLNSMSSFRSSESVIFIYLFVPLCGLLGTARLRRRAQTCSQRAYAALRSNKAYLLTIKGEPAHLVLESEGLISWRNQSLTASLTIPPPPKANHITQGPTLGLLTGWLDARGEVAEMFRPVFNYDI